MIIRSRLLGIAALAAVAIVSLGGCAGATPAAPAGPGPANPGSTSGTPQPPAATALGGLPASCPTVALVNSKLGISTASPKRDGSATSLDCLYVATSAANSVSIDFSTKKKLTKTAAEAALKGQGVSAAFSEVQEIGDFAFYDRGPSGGGYIAGESGSVAYHIVASGSVTKEQLTDLARAVLAQ